MLHRLRPGHPAATRPVPKLLWADLFIQVTWVVVTEVQSDIASGWLQSAVSTSSTTQSYFSSSSVVSRVFSAICVYSTFGHHPHPLGYLCAKFRFCCGLHCWASPWRKIAYSLVKSLNHPAYLMRRKPKLSLRNIIIFSLDLEHSSVDAHLLLCQVQWLYYCSGSLSFCCFWVSK